MSSTTRSCGTLTAPQGCVWTPALWGWCKPPTGSGCAHWTRCPPTAGQRRRTKLPDYAANPAAVTAYAAASSPVWSQRLPRRSTSGTGRLGQALTLHRAVESEQRSCRGWRTRSWGGRRPRPWRHYGVAQQAVFVLLDPAVGQVSHAEQVQGTRVDCPGSLSGLGAGCLIAITHLHEHGGIHDASTTGSRNRVQQDNELRHLLIRNRNTVSEQAAMYVLRFALHV
jgi:hypothetical protein